MSSTESSFSARINVYARWRPVARSELASGEIPRSIIPGNHSRSSISISCPGSPGRRPWTSPFAFDAVLGPEDDNAKVYDVVVAPALPKVLQGGNCNFFAYGHSGSGKTHTILGSNLGRLLGGDEELGMCLTAARQLFNSLGPLNKELADETLGIGFSLFELRKKAAFDLLNNRTKCHVREGSDGKTHIRGETETLEGEKIRVCSIVQKTC